jgi:PAS domain S-box-containing protein
MSGSAAPEIEDGARLVEIALAHQRDAMLITEADRVHPAGRRILWINPAFTAITGFSPAEAIGRTPGITVGSKTDRATLGRIQEAIEAKRPIREEVLKYKKDGTSFWAEIDIAPVAGTDGVCRHFVCVMRDITEKKLLQAQLLEADRLASLGTLAAGVAHEINNPLAYVLSNVEFARRWLEQLPAGDDLDDVRTAVDEARHGAERVSRIVADLKVFSRREPVEAGPVDVARVLDGCVQMVGNQIRHRARLVREYGDAPPALGDESRLAQVFLNLLINALQAIPVGNAEEHLIHIRVSPSDGMVVVEVRDSGTGIAPEVLPYVFDPFFTTKPAGVGTGFGLSICHGIVRAAGGRIDVESRPGEGALFRVSLPAAHRAARGQAPAPAPAPSPGVDEQRRRVLVVDDEPMLTRSLERVLGDQHDVVAATSGAEALDRLAGDERFDLILCDVMMPEMTGIELYQRVRSAWPGLERRIAFMTGGAFANGVAEFLDGLDNPRLDKPLNFALLRALLRELA